jgi:hypothetical protein
MRRWVAWVFQQPGLVDRGLEYDFHACTRGRNEFKRQSAELQGFGRIRARQHPEPYRRLLQSTRHRGRIPVPGKVSSSQGH